MSLEIPVAAYFHPQDHQDAHRVQHAKTFNLPPIPSEMELLKKATPLFPGHAIPTYTIDEGAHTEWVDSDINAIAKQKELAQEAKVGAWIVNAYAGIIDDQSVVELQGPLDNIAQQADDTLQFALMGTLTLPRVKLPIHTHEDSLEHQRSFDLTFSTFKKIIDYAAQYWDNPHYLHMNGSEPYLTIYGLRSSVVEYLLANQPHIIPDVLDYTHSQYGVNPYLTANAYNESGAQQLQKLGFQHITTYSFLPDFYEKNHDPHSLNQQARPQDLQEYGKQLEARMREAKVISETLGITGFNPSAVVGWDASSRGTGAASIADVSGKFPFTPIIPDSTPENFKRSLTEVTAYQKEHLPLNDQLVTIFAWNEIGNGASLLPRLLPDGRIDTSYIKATREFVDGI